MRPLERSSLIVAAGVCAALHVAKLPPAVPALQQSLGLTLVQAGFLLAVVQAVGMSVGVAIGSAADALGARRAMLGGLALLAGCSAVGALAQTLPTLLLLRALEGLGFMLVVLPGPGWLRMLTPPQRLPGVLALWSAYMPLATAAALAAGPSFTAALGWRAWWWAMAVITAAMAVVLARTLRPAQSPPPQTPSLHGLAGRLHLTLRAPGPWLCAAVFALYAFQWLAVIGFLPTLVLQAGFSTASTGALTAAVAAANIAGNLGGGRLMQRGVPAGALLTTGLVAMMLGATGLFAADPPALRLAGATLFSAFGGLVPVVLFNLAVRAAPAPQAMATTVGWMQQGSALGQFCGPPAVAWLASASGGWQFSAWVTGAAAVLALALVPLLLRSVAGR